MLKNITYISAAAPKKKKTEVKPAKTVKRNSTRNVPTRSFAITSSARIVNTVGLLAVFIIGVVVGTLFINIFCGDEYDKFGIYSKYFIEKFHESDVEKKALFLYSFWGRSKEIIFLLVLSFTSFGKIVAELFLAYKGLTVGILISVYVLQYGAGGLLLYGASIFPHYIAYVLMVMMLVSFSKEIYHCIQGYREDTQVQLREAIQMILKAKFMPYLKCLFIILILNVLASYLETFVNLGIMKNILK